MKSGGGEVGLPVLFATILAGTLLSGQFLAAALMAWMYQFWRHQHRVAQHRLRRQLLPSLTQRPRFARLSVGDAEVEVPADRLHAGDRIVVEEGEMVPADGWLAGGFAVVDERLVRGVAGLSRKEAGDPVYAGSFAIEGRLYLEVSGQGTATRGAQLGRALAAAATPPPADFALTAQGEAFARGPSARRSRPPGSGWPSATWPPPRPSSGPTMPPGRAWASRWNRSATSPRAPSRAS